MKNFTGLLNKLTRSGSLRYRIALLYVALALTNILFFTALVLEDQVDLLRSGFERKAEDLVSAVLDKMKNVSIGSPEDRASLEKIENTLINIGIDSFSIFDAQGNIWHVFSLKADSKKAKERVDSELLRKASQMALMSGVYRTRSKIEYDPKDYSINFLLSLNDRKTTGLFLHTRLELDSIRSRRNQMYFRMSLVIAWGILFHILFAIFVYRIIFQRIGILEKASNRMAGGDLDTRVSWRWKTNDELDRLGTAFNSMASKIEEKVNTISRLIRELRTELLIGQDVQKLFLPSKDALSNFNIAISYRPLREVSGDIYNFYEFKRKKKGLFFADASGHGVSAALITTVTVMSLENIVEQAQRPREIITLLNTVLCERLHAAFFATAVFINMDEKGRVMISNAGHNPPLLVRRRQKKIEEIVVDGPPLGMMVDLVYDDNKYEMESGDKLLLFSDGLVETANDEGEEFGLKRVKQLILSNINKPNQIIIEKLASSLEEHADHYRDDVTMILVEMP